jgi:hypothetical protein
MAGSKKGAAPVTWQRRRISGREALIVGGVGWGLYLAALLASGLFHNGPSSQDRACQSYRDDERVLAISLYPSPSSLADGMDVGTRAALEATELQRQQEHDTLVTSHPDCFSAQQVQAASARLQTTTP